ncbi:MAG: DUF4105 domain-containing protein [Parabacteroides sp.]|nr:DUF4105 domain-containing protein [Parabacteroides sp.]
MKRLGTIFFFLLLLCPLTAQTQLSDQAQISLLTAAPSDEEVFTLYGHSAIRVNDPENKIDWVFNYGIFDFNQPNFLLRFMLGKTDYILGINKFDDYFIEYQIRGSEVTEQVLNLSAAQKQQVWAYLLWNALPENRTYRYNFFFDNCATRPRDIIEKAAGGQVRYEVTDEKKTFRDLITQCTRNHSWYTFGCDLVLGAPTDRTASVREAMFLPVYLKNGVAQATVALPDGQNVPLVASSHILITGTAEEASDTRFTPFVAGMLLLLLTVLITGIEWRRKTYFRAVDIVLFAVAGISGCLIFFLWFVSEHPSVNANWNLLWLNPVELVAAVLFAVKKRKKAAYCYHFINFATLTLLLIGWKWIPQQMEPAFIPYILTLWTRSGYGVYRFIKRR